jgi:hypothetical protein
VEDRISALGSDAATTQSSHRALIDCGLGEAVLE